MASDRTFDEIGACRLTIAAGLLGAIVGDGSLALPAPNASVYARDRHLAGSTALVAADLGARPITRAAQPPRRHSSSDAPLAGSPLCRVRAPV